MQDKCFHCCICSLCLSSISALQTLNSLPTMNLESYVIFSSKSRLLDCYERMVPLFIRFVPSHSTVVEQFQTAFEEHMGSSTSGWQIEMSIFTSVCLHFCSHNKMCLLNSEAIITVQQIIADSKHKNHLFSQGTSQIYRTGHHPQRGLPQQCLLYLFFGGVKF